MEEVVSSEATARVFIGSSNVSRIEEKTLIHSLKKNTRGDLEIHVLKGDERLLETHCGSRISTSPILFPDELMPYNLTNWSLLRFAVPDICANAGRAVYLDSDTLVLDDIGELFRMPLADNDFAMRKSPQKPGMWASAVALFDCAKSRFNLKTISSQLRRGIFTYRDWMWLTPAFLRFHPHRIAEIPARWHALDSYDPETKLIHYTFIPTQPWRCVGHPHGDLWFRYFDEARRTGDITQKDISTALENSCARRDLLKGNRPDVFSSVRHHLVKAWKKIVY